MAAADDINKERTIVGNPTPSEIGERAEAIRAKWSYRTRLARAGKIAPGENIEHGSVRTPIVATPDKLKAEIDFWERGI